MTIYNRTCKCGVSFTTDNHRIQTCPDCVVAREQTRLAAHEALPLRPCKQCGKGVHSKKLSPRCNECNDKNFRARRDSFISTPRPTPPAPKQNETDEQRDARRKDLAKWVLQQPRDMQARVFAIILDFIVAKLAEEKQPTMVEVNPEEIPADDQDAIDAQFYSLMEGFDL